MLIGDYWLESEGDIPSAALVALLADFGVNDAASRAALSRMVKRGLLRSTRSGRNTAYRATDRGQEVLHAASRRIVELGGASANWSGVWSVVAFELPENARSLRAAVRNRLVWLGFAQLYDEVWICPHDRHEDAVRELGILGVTATPFQASLAESNTPTRSPLNAWDLTELEGSYREFSDRAQAALDDLAAGRLSPTAALVARTRLLQHWLELTGRDPELPDTILPRSWPRDRARALLVRAHGELGPLATSHVRAVVATFDPAAADSVELRTSTDWERLAR